MSAKERIGRLQDLLERVQSRALEARATNGAVYAAAAPAIAAAPVGAYDTATPEPQSVDVEHDSLPPPTAQGGAQPELDAYDEDADVEVSSETVEVDIDIDEPMAMESGAQPVAHQTMPPEDLEEEIEEQPVARTTGRPERPDLPRPTPDEEITQAFVAPPPPPANEIEEPAPSSSRRPIAAEEVAETYGEESAPRHTPPPESGKQVAAPSVHPVASATARPATEPPLTPINTGVPSAPPPVLEGQALVGGWREPGLGPVPAPGVSGVHTPLPPAALPAAGVPAQPSGTRLSPDVTRPELPATATVARLESPAAVARPATMGELLDMTLSL